MFVHIRKNETPVGLRAAERKVVTVRRQYQRIVLFRDSHLKPFGWLFWAHVVSFKIAYIYFYSWNFHV